MFNSKVLLEVICDICCSEYEVYKNLQRVKKLGYVECAHCGYHVDFRHAFNERDDDDDDTAVVEKV